MDLPGARGFGSGAASSLDDTGRHRSRGKRANQVWENSPISGGLWVRISSFGRPFWARRRRTPTEPDFGCCSVHSTQVGDVPTKAVGCPKAVAARRCAFRHGSDPECRPNGWGDQMQQLARVQRTDFLVVRMVLRKQECSSSEQGKTLLAEFLVVLSGDPKS